MQYAEARIFSFLKLVRGNLVARAGSTALSKFRPRIRFLQPTKGIKRSLKMARALVLAIKQVLARALKALRRLIRPNKP